MKQVCTLIGIFLFLGTLAINAAPEPQRYTILMAGNRAGTQTALKHTNNDWQFEYEFNDRGRGPKLSTHIVVGTESIPVLIETKGNDYLKAPVEESFQIKDSIASWKSSSENGNKPVLSPAFYVSTNSVPHEIALLAQALLASPQKKLPLLPDGEAAIEQVGGLEVRAAGKTKKVHQYSISGLGFSPTFVWLEEDQSYFASASNWFSVVQDGWESVLSELIKKQDEITAAQNKKIAKSLAHHPKGALVIENGNVFDPVSGRLIPETTVVISGNRITSVGPKVKMPADTEVIDATGKTVMAGLWDMHVHLSETDGPMNIAAGVTSVRDLANDIDFVTMLRDQFDRGETIGPRVALVGFMDGPGPYAGPTKILVDNEQQVREAVDRYAKLGYVQIKMYSSIKPELVPVIIQAAHQHGMRVSGHIPANMTAEQCVKLGFDEIQHANFLILNFFPDVKDTRTPLRFTAVAEKAADLDLNSETVQNFIRLLKERNIVLDPTVNVFEGLFTDRPGTISATIAAVENRLPPLVRRGYLLGGLPVPEGKDDQYHKSYEAMKKFVGMLYKAGIPIVAGTDALAGFTLHRELEIYVESGIPANEVLKIATMGAARVMKQEKELGSIEKGKLADIIIVDGDPVTQISDIRKVSTVIKGGVVFQSAQIYPTLGIRP